MSPPLRWASTSIVLRQREKLHPCRFDTFRHVRHQVGLQVYQGGRFTLLNGNVSKFTRAISSMPISPLHRSQTRGAAVCFPFKIVHVYFAKLHSKVFPAGLCIQSSHRNESKESSRQRQWLCLKSLTLRLAYIHTVEESYVAKFLARQPKTKQRLSDATVALLMRLNPKLPGFKYSALTTLPKAYSPLQSGQSGIIHWSIVTEQSTTKQ